MITNGVSVLVCTYNGKSKLTPTLEHLFNQKGLENINWEILVIDNSSVDGSFEWVKIYLKQNKTSVNIQLLKEQKAGKSAAISLGIKTAQYSYLLICDDDNWLDPHYISFGFKILKKNKQIGILGGNGRPAFDNLPKWIKPHLHNYAAAPQSLNSGYLTDTIGSVYGAGMFIKREIYIKAFDLQWPLYLSSRREKNNVISGEDTEICYVAKCLGYQIYYEKDLTFRHDIPIDKLTASYLLRLFNLFGYGAAILYPYDRGLSFKDSYFIKLLLEVYRLMRYNFLNNFFSNEISVKKSYEYRKGFIKGLLENYRRINQLKSFLKKFDTSTSHHFKQR